MVLITALVLAGQQLNRPAFDAVELFRQACVNGEARLPSGAMKVASDQLPPNVKVAFGQNLIDPRLLASVGVPLVVSTSDNLPNDIYEFHGANQTFLLLPINPARKGQPFDRMCAVAVQADRMVDALAALAPKEAERAARQQAKGKSLPAYFRGKSGKYDVSVAVVSGWTSIAAVHQ